MLYICILILNIIFLFSLCVLNKRKLRQYEYKIEQKTKEKYINENREKLEFEIRYSLRDLETQRDALENEVIGRQIALDQMRKRASQYEEQLRDMALDNAKQYEETLMNVARDKVENWQAESQKAAELAHAETMAKLGEQAKVARAQIEVFTKEIEEYSAKQAAINEAILRQRAIEEQQDFYRVCLAPETANDVEVLNIARQNLKKPEIIDKIIYDNYIAKPVLEMVKRVLQNSTCSGIYKITCIKTGEIYIGKSTDVKSRWQQHCKTVFNCGTIASSLLHTKMKQHGIENFTFELIEQVPKDQLSEREKFYINFYQTKEVGLNERNG